MSASLRARESWHGGVCVVLALLKGWGKTEEGTEKGKKNHSWVRAGRHGLRWELGLGPFSPWERGRGVFDYRAKTFLGKYRGCLEGNLLPWREGNQSLKTGWGSLLGAVPSGAEPGKGVPCVLSCC